MMLLTLELEVATVAALATALQAKLQRMVSNAGPEAVAAHDEAVHHLGVARLALEEAGRQVGYMKERIDD